jgi:hypothetical protein
VLRICVCGQIEVTIILAMDQNAKHMNHRIKGHGSCRSMASGYYTREFERCNFTKNMSYRANNLPLMCRNSAHTREGWAICSPQ